MRPRGDDGAGNHAPGEPRPVDGASGPRLQRCIPWLAVAAVILFVVGVLWPPLFVACIVVCVGGVSSLAILRRAKPPLVRACVAVALWLAVALIGVWWLRSATLGGLTWVLLVLFLLPLPVVPWLYARSFEEEPDPSSAPSTPRAAPEGDDVDSGSPAPAGGA